jgi:ankyrin repeat protein
MALHWAAEFGELKVVKLLLEHSEDKNPADKDGRTPLHSAARHGYLEMVKLLLEHAEDKNQADKNGRTPFSLGCRTW